MTTDTEEKREIHPLGRMVRLQAILERGRISADNQRRGLDPGAITDVFDTVAETLGGLEKMIEKQMHIEVSQHPAWFWLEKVKGIGPQTSSLMLAYLLPPIPGKGPSSWYKAAGLYSIRVACKECDGAGKNIDGIRFKQCEKCGGEGGTNRLPRYSNLPKGEKASWHPRLRRNLYIVGDCLIRANGFYKKFYDEVKAALVIKHPDWKGRCHSVAFWKMVKLFLSHFWEVWSKEIGVETRGPYPMEILGHRKIEVPWEGG